MVSTVTPYTDSRNRAYPGMGYDGVVRISAGDYYGTGVLLYGGRAVLTAAHLFAGNSGDVAVHFETTAGLTQLASAKVVESPGYDASGNDDLAIVWLAAPAPVAAQRYQLYRQADEIGQVMTLVGYGKPGTGESGVLSAYSAEHLRQMATNTADVDMATLKQTFGNAMAWSPKPGSQLGADFDNGLAAQDALGLFAGVHQTGTGASEGSLTPGDSGGPAFIQGQVAGIASYSASLSLGSLNPDANGVTDSTFGEVAAWQRVSFYQQWIDQSLRAAYVNAPTKPQDVQVRVAEGNSGTTLTYFLLQFTGVRSSPGQVLSVDYATRDGTAIHGQDYIAASGTLKLYPGEVQAVIPVEIIGDSTPEPDEVFYMDVTHPVGGSFAPGVVTLTAMRTIVNDDGGAFG